MIFTLYFISFIVLLSHVQRICVDLLKVLKCFTYFVKKQKKHVLRKHSETFFFIEKKKPFGCVLHLIIVLMINTLKPLSVLKGH